MRCASMCRARRGSRTRIEVVFEVVRPFDDRTCQVTEAGTQLAAMLLELERSTGRWMLASVKRQADGAAPLIGSSEAIKRVRERIERVAATDFCVLIEGASGPESHPSVIEVFC
jgi:DNA-binding NtrC family response regulator